MNEDSQQREWTVPVYREGAWRAVSVVARDASEATRTAEGVVDADGVDQWPLFAIKPHVERPCGQCGHPNPGAWCNGCGWQK
jgi:hypothetical protein